jgi:hypothetical protein
MFHPANDFKFVPEYSYAEKFPDFNSKIKTIDVNSLKPSNI